MKFWILKNSAGDIVSKAQYNWAGVLNVETGAIPMLFSDESANEIASRVKYSKHQVEVKEICRL